MAQDIPVPQIIKNYNNFYIPVNKAIAAIIPRNNKIIPMATKVSCSSTELIFFIIFNFNVNKNCVLKGKLEKNLTIRQFLWERISTKL